ncbi:MAG TPA: endopeptidase La [Aggregatilinea sp.]|uniref:endopeptidase La n=1 Tax=Aggregatilinea sp. TaxID=2806333 RepID=UPI002C6EDED5|nr:endopeptidase La [Aggregatilinea sp.]HML20060.1 endopeptidase La [Aggregatilinea sp.]
MLGHGINDFYAIQDAVPDADGLIEAAVIPLINVVIFPNMVAPLFVQREQDLLAISGAQADGRTVIGIALREPDPETITPEDLFATGTEMALGRTLNMPQGGTSVLVQGRRRVEIVEFVQTEPYMRVRARPIEVDEDADHDSTALMRATTNLFQKCVQLNPRVPEEAYIYALNIEEPGWLADMIVSTLDLPLPERQSLLELVDPVERLRQVSALLGRELEVLELEESIQSQVRDEVDRGQREMFLREQMRVIQNELGEADIYQQEINELRDRIAQAGLPDAAHDKAEKELARLALVPPMAPEVGIIRTYLEWLVDLPWSAVTEDNLDLSNAAKVLDEEHYGLPKAKDRILEHIAVRKLAPDKMRSPILCFVGPPGTGKTSLGKSIAKALGREFVRVSLGGVRDEAEIRGHRRTYIGALPGRILQTMRRAGTVNPVFMLDEIDKLGMDFRGDPAAALLEVLDPEQNAQYSDHYLEVDYDLSKVFFITTANYLDPVPPALLDRMELIEFPGYVEEEKLEIAKAYLIPRLLEQHGLDGRGLHFDDETIRLISREYTYEAGVRNLEREIAQVCRKLARRVAEEKTIPKRIVPASLTRYLGPPEFILPLAEEEDEIGVATGLAWTEAGGDIMAIEVSLMPGKGTLQLTGQLGEVMQESAQAALSYTRALAGQWDIDPDEFDRVDIHVHLPEGAIPKDGPSAGITLATAMISAFTQRPIRRDVAMTGEITLRGRILPIGGVREKLLAARRAGVKTVLLPKRNEKDLADIPKRTLRGLTIVLVDRMDDVLAQALLPAVY